MNSVACLNVILKQIQRNAYSFENTDDLQKVVTLLFKLGTEVMQKILPSSLLKSVILTVKQLYEKNIIKNNDHKLFMITVNNFYRSQNLCDSYRIAILSCFLPAVELEVLSLLKLCSNAKSTDELVDIRLAIESSLLIHVCQENIEITRKVIRILKKAFLLSKGNPVICYLTFCFCKSVELPIYNPYLLSKELSGLDAFFQLPYHLFTVEDGELFIKHLIKSCFDREKLKLCTKNDIMFYTTIYPMCFRKMLDLCEHQMCILDFFTFLGSDNNFDISERKNHINLARENRIWQLLCC